MTHLLFYYGAYNVGLPERPSPAIQLFSVYTAIERRAREDPARPSLGNNPLPLAGRDREGGCRGEHPHPTSPIEGEESEKT
jgi:hypothetical protein